MHEEWLHEEGMHWGILQHTWLFRLRPCRVIMVIYFLNIHLSLTGSLSRYMRFWLNAIFSWVETAPLLQTCSRWRMSRNGGIASVRRSKGTGRPNQSRFWQTKRNLNSVRPFNLSYFVEKSNRYHHIVQVGLHSHRHQSCLCMSWGHVQWKDREETVLPACWNDMFVEAKYLCIYSCTISQALRLSLTSVGSRCLFSVFNLLVKLWSTGPLRC